jgi:hypothetical protein
LSPCSARGRLSSGREVEYPRPHAPRGDVSPRDERLNILVPMLRVGTSLLTLCVSRLLAAYIQSTIAEVEIQTTTNSSVGNRAVSARATWKHRARPSIEVACGNDCGTSSHRNRLQFKKGLKGDPLARRPRVRSGTCDRMHFSGLALRRARPARLARLSRQFSTAVGASRGSLLRRRGGRSPGTARLPIVG